MKRTYLVVFEKGDNSWGAFALDVAGTGGMGGTIAEARQSLLEGIGYILDHNLEHSLPVPDAIATSVDFSEFDPNPEQSHYEIEWLTIDIPERPAQTLDRTQQAA